MENQRKITVDLVEDYKLVTKSVEIMLRTTNDMELIGTFETAEEFLETVKERQADVVIMDLGLPGMNGLAATKILKEQYPDVKVIIFTSLEHNEEVIASLALGASAYCLKDVEATELQEVIRQAYKGALWVHPKVKDATKAYTPTPNSTDFDNLYTKIKQESNLSERELAVLEKIVEGKTNTEIAQEMNISIHTVKAHVASILDKLCVTDRVKAAVKAVKEKIVY